MFYFKFNDKIHRCASVDPNFELRYSNKISVVYIYLQLAREYIYIYIHINMHMLMLSKSPTQPCPLLGFVNDLCVLYVYVFVFYLYI